MDRTTWLRGLSKVIFLTGTSILLFSLLRFVESGDPAQSIRRGAVAGPIFTVVFVVFAAVVARRSWPQGKTLRYSERVAVQRSVYDGKDVGEDRLAQAVLDYCGVVRKQRRTNRRYEWVMVFFFAGLAIVFALIYTFAGPTRGAVVYWGSVGFWLLVLWRRPRRRDRRARLDANVARAEALARARLEGVGR